MKYHLIGYIDGSEKVKPAFLAIANPVKYDSFGQELPPVFNFIEETECFEGPATLEWFDEIDKFQCDPETNDIRIWEPDLSRFEDVILNFKQGKVKGHRLKPGAYMTK